MFFVRDSRHFSWGAATPNTFAPKDEERCFLNYAVWIMGPLAFNP